jgi:hypothetical protein
MENVFATYGTRTPTRLPSRHWDSCKINKFAGHVFTAQMLLVALAEPTHHPVQPSCALVHEASLSPPKSRNNFSLSASSQQAALVSRMCNKWRVSSNGRCNRWRGGEADAIGRKAWVSLLSKAAVKWSRMYSHQFLVSARYVSPLDQVLFLPYMKTFLTWLGPLHIITWAISLPVRCTSIQVCNMKTAQSMWGLHKARSPVYVAWNLT